MSHIYSYPSANSPLSPVVINHHETFASKIVIFSPLCLPVLFSHHSSLAIWHTIPFVTSLANIFQICSYNSLFPTGLWRLMLYLSVTESDHSEMWCFVNVYTNQPIKADDRRTIKLADFITRFYRPIFSAKLESSSTVKSNLSPIISADKIGR